MEQPSGFIQTDSSLVCRFKKSLYGLKQPPRPWYAKMDSFLLDTGFSRCHFDNTVYTKKVGKSLIVLVLYVDDLILNGSDPNLINHVKSSLKKQFEMTDFDTCIIFLVFNPCNPRKLFPFRSPSMPVIFYATFTWKLSCTKRGNGDEFPKRARLVEKLLYLTHTHPELSFVVGLITRFMQNPHESHWKVAKRILRYVRGTIQFGIHYSAKASLLVGFTDSDWAGDPDDEKSTVGYVFTLGFRPITWACKKQSIVAP
eukprot:PITA_27443